MSGRGIMRRSAETKMPDTWFTEIAPLSDVAEDVNVFPPPGNKGHSNMVLLAPAADVTFNPPVVLPILISQ
jgi:hypothetical protein